MDKDSARPEHSVLCEGMGERCTILKGIPIIMNIKFSVSLTGDG